MADLMQATGLNKKSIYNEFGNKESLFIRSLNLFIQQSSYCFRPILLKEPLGLDNLKRFFTELFIKFEATGCLLTLSLNEANCIPTEALTKINQTLKSIEQAFFLNLQALDNVNDIKAKMLSRNLLALMQGYTSLSRSEELRATNRLDAIEFLKFIESGLN
jgi:TetR/AcrR family transcriptional repressor of nem operon